MRYLICQRRCLLLLRVRKTKQLFLCLLLVAVIYLLYAHNFHTLKLIEISKIDKNYAVLQTQEKVTDFIMVISRQDEAMPQKRDLSAEGTKLFMANRSNGTSIKNLSGKNDRLTKDERYKVKMSATNSVQENVRASTKINKNVIAFTTQTTEFMAKNTTDNFKLPKSPNYSTKTKEENIRKPLLATTIPSNLFKKGLKHSMNFGYLNVHIWYDVCEDKVESLRGFILFPQVPSRRSKTNSFQIQESGSNFGLRIFGFLHPHTSGDYKFGISSNNNSELWLSLGERRENLRRVAFVGSENETKYSGSGNYYKFSSQISKPIYLKQGEKYFVVVLYKHGVGKSHVEVAWISPNESSFRIISEKSISMFVDETHLEDNIVPIDDYSEQDTSSLQKQVGFDPFFTIPFIDEADINEVLPSCPYEPSYYIKEKLVRFQGARNKSNTHFAAVFPPDDSNATLSLVAGEDVWWTENNMGNELVSENVALKVVQQYMEAFTAKYSGKNKTYDLLRAKSVEQVQDKTKGDRYLLELELSDNRRARNVRLSEFVYKPKGTERLCIPKGFQWKKNATINIIVPLRNSGRWAFYLVQNIAEIIKRSEDQNIKLVIVDYESSDIDIRRLMKKSSIKNYAIVTLSKKKEFRRAEALQKGAEVVTDPHSILFLCDLHLKIPVTLADIIRKHCVEGKMAFAPVVKRLKCGFYPERPYGYWETLGFGLFAIYKSDYDHVGGMNVAEFKGWGGEDWELLDRVLESKREVERLKVSGFYHFFHPSLNGYNQRLHV